MRNIYAVEIQDKHYRDILWCQVCCIKLWWLFAFLHTVDMKIVTPALRQTVTAISTTNTWCTIFKRDSFNIKVHVVYKILALVLAIISLLDQQKTLLLSLHLEVWVTVFVSTVCISQFMQPMVMMSSCNIQCHNCYILRSGVMSQPFLLNIPLAIWEVKNFSNITGVLRLWFSQSWSGKRYNFHVTANQVMNIKWFPLEKWHSTVFPMRNQSKINSQGQIHE